MSLKYKILLIIFAVSLLPIFIMSFATARISTNLLIEQEVDSKVKILRDISEKVYMAIQDRQLVGINFLLNDNVQNLLTPKIKDSLAFSKQEKLTFEIEKMLQNYKNLSGTESLFLYSVEGERYTNSKDSTYQLEDFIVREWFQEARLDEKSYFWGDPLIEKAGQTIPLVRIIRKITSPITIGYLISTVKESYFAKLYSNFVIEGSSNFYIVNERGIIISHNDKGEIGKSLKEKFPNFSMQDGSEGYTTVAVANNEYLLIYYFDTRTGWTFLNSVSGRDIKLGARYILAITYILSGILVVICFFIAFLLTKNVIQPIKLLAERMEKAQSGDWDVAVKTNKTGEIGKLEKSFEVMIKELKHTFDEMIAIQEQKRKAELKVLEFQINPHFLYNTMSTIIWLSDMKQNEAVVKVAESLSELFRLSISKGSEFISIEEEFSHVQHYIEIQQVRYMDEFTIEYFLDDRIKKLYTIKLILQPLVENAIYHGIKPNEHSGLAGNIRVEGTLGVDGKVIFRVIDNGNMLSQVDVMRINTFLTNKGLDDKFGVGIRNVHDRIQLAYGSDFGIRFLFDPDLTIVEATIPVNAAKHKEDN